MNIEEIIKNKISKKEYIILDSNIAEGLVFKITENGSLTTDGYEIGYLYLKTGSSIKKHKHINDIERYELIKGNLSIDSKKANTNICLFNESHCIDKVTEDTYIKTCKINKNILNNLPTPIDNNTFDHIINLR